MERTEGSEVLIYGSGHGNDGAVGAKVNHRKGEKAIILGEVKSIRKEGSTMSVRGKDR